MRSTQKKENKTKISANSDSVARNTRSKANKDNTCAVNITNLIEENNEKLQRKRKRVRKCSQDTTDIDTNGIHNIETKSSLLVALDAKIEIPKKSEDGSETTASVPTIRTEKNYKPKTAFEKKVETFLNTLSNVRKKKLRSLDYDNFHKNLKIKQQLKLRNRKKALSNSKLLKSTKDPPSDTDNSHKNAESNELAEEIKDAAVDKLPNIVIQRNFSEKTNGCENARKICKVWLTNVPHKVNNSNTSTSEIFPNNDAIANEIKPSSGKNDSGSKNSSDSELKEEKITNIINGCIDCTNLSDIESTTTFSNLSANSNCALCVEVPKEKKIIQRTDDNLDTNPFVKYRLESCDFNIKITKTLQGEPLRSESSRGYKKRWTYSHFLKSQTYIIRITSKDPIFFDAILEKDDEIRNSENEEITKSVLNTENLRDDNSQNSTSPLPYKFLLPLLPLSKRPPTRRPVNIVQSTEDDASKKIPPPEDDTISLYARSIVSSPEMDPEELDDKVNENETDRSDITKENLTIPSPHADNSIKEVISSKANNVSENHETIKEMINSKTNNVSQNHETVKEMVNSKCNNTREKRETIKEMVNSKTNNSPEKHEKGESVLHRHRQSALTYNYIPNIFRGVCYHYLTEKYCRRKPYCTRLHGLYPNTEESILNLSYEELRQVYDFSKRKIFYKETFPFFVKAFVKQKKILDLVRIVNDIVDQDMFERSPFVEKIVEAIQSIGYSFYQTIDEIITILGITNLKICLSDILINIVVRSSGNLEADWPLIKKLIKYRTDKLDHGVVEDIIRISVEFKSVLLCVNTFRDILNTELVNLECLNVELLKLFVVTLRKLNLIEESKILTEKANIPSNEDDDVANDMDEVISERCLSENDPYQLEENFSLPSFPESEKLFENSYEMDELSASMSHSEEEIGTPYVCDTILPTNSAASEISCSSKTIPAKAVSSLTSVIKDKDVSKFLGILERYKDDNYVESFVLTVIKLLKKEDLNEVYKMMNKIFNTISTEKYKHRFWSESHARNLIETLSFNVIALFDRPKSWKIAANIIKRFSCDYANFAKVKCTKIHKYDYTELGKYLYFCKIFIRAGYLQDTYELLMDPDLRLLNEKTTWTISHHQSFDSGFRDEIVKIFLIQSISTEVDLAKKFLLWIIRDASCILNIDVWQYYNDLLVALMNNQKYHDILEMLDDILNGWNLKLKKEVFRGLLIILLRLPDVDPFKIMTLYVCACKRGFYRLYTGMEKEIVLKTDMLYEEIYLILHTFFLRRVSCGLLASDDLCLKLQLPDIVDERPSFLVNSNVSINDFRIKICRVLAVAFYHPVCVEETQEMFSIIVDKKQLEILLRFYKNQNAFFV